MPKIVLSRLGSPMLEAGGAVWVGVCPAGEDEMRLRARRSQGVAGPRPGSISLESPVEHLGISVWARNALRSIGCGTVEQALLLDLSISVRGIGSKTKQQ